MPSSHPLLANGAGRRGLLKLLTVTVASDRDGGRRTVSLPMVMHRPFPPGAIVKTVTVHRRYTAQSRRESPGYRARHDGERWLATFNLGVPAPPAPCSLPEPAGGGLVAGIDIGWRQVEGGIRVATICGSDGSVDHVILPEAMIERRNGLSAVAGAARQALNRAAAAARAAGILAPAQGNNEPRETRAAVFACAADMAAHGGRLAAEYRDAVYELRHCDKAAAHGNDAFTAARRHFYRVAAKAIAERFSRVAIDAEVKQLARRRPAGEDELPPIARRLRTWSSPSELAAEIARAVKARGGEMLYATGKSTVTCHHCGHENRLSGRDILIQHCANPRCGRYWDQDENAAHLLCALAAGTGPPAAVTLRRKENQGLKRARLTRKRKA